MTQVVAPRSDADWEQFVAVAAQSFGAPLHEVADRYEKRRSRVLARFALHGGRVLGGAMALPAQQFFGGQPVPAGAVAAVCVLPEFRGRGLGAQIMRSLHDAMREAGLVVAPLWPSTIRFYRRMGWEVTVRGQRHAIAPAAFASFQAEGQAVRDPGQEVRAVHRACAPAWNGPLDRPEWWWEHRESAPYPNVLPEHRIHYGWKEKGRLTGFLEYTQQPSLRRGHDVTVRDLWAQSPDALRGLLGILGATAAQVNEVIFPFWVLPNRHDLLWMLAEAEHDLHSDGRLAWMLRLVDPAAALEARGWPASLGAQLEFLLEDPFVNEPQRLVLAVDRGRAAVRPGGAGRIVLGAGALASWYSGALSASHAARLGLLRASARDLEIMDSLTADRPLWLPDFF